jgi:hypothetical protein
VVERGVEVSGDDRRCAAGAVAGQLVQVGPPLVDVAAAGGDRVVGDESHCAELATLDSHAGERGGHVGVARHRAEVAGYERGDAVEVVDVTVAVHAGRGERPVPVWFDQRCQPVSVGRTGLDERYQVGTFAADQRCYLVDVGRAVQRVEGQDGERPPAGRQRLGLGARYDQRCADAEHDHQHARGRDETAVAP